MVLEDTVNAQPVLQDFLSLIMRHWNVIVDSESGALNGGCSAGLQQPVKQREQGAGPGGHEVLRDRVHDNQIE